MGRQADLINEADLELDLEDVEMDREQLRLLASMRRLIREGVNKIMADLEPINAAINEQNTQLAQLADQVAAIQAGVTSQADIDALAARIRQAAIDTDAIVEPDAGETPPEPGA